MPEPTLALELAPTPTFVNPKDLGVMCYARSHTWWNYATHDEPSRIGEAEYWRPIADMLHTGDMMIVHFTDASGKHQLVQYAVLGIVPVHLVPFALAKE